MAVFIDIHTKCQLLIKLRREKSREKKPSVTAEEKNKGGFMNLSSPNTKFVTNVTTNETLLSDF